MALTMGRYLTVRDSTIKYIRVENFDIIGLLAMMLTMMPPLNSLSIERSTSGLSSLFFTVVLVFGKRAPGLSHTVST